MKFTINKDFANRYNNYRQKEELQKLKERYGDVRLKKQKVDKPDPCENTNDVESSFSSSSSSDDDDETAYSSSAEREHEDFLVLYEALCRNDPQLNDPSKQWFHERDENDSSNTDDRVTETGTEHNSSYSESTTKSHKDKEKNKNKKSKKDKPGKTSVLTLRDYDRQFLLEHGGIEEESVAAEAKMISKLESDVVLKRLSEKDENASKALFLKEANDALRNVHGEEMDAESTDEPSTAGFLVRRKADPSEDERRNRRKIDVNVNNLLFTDQPNSEAEAFLRDYIVNQRWRHPASRIPSYSEVLRSANLEVDQTANQVVPEEDTINFPDDSILDEDDEFLIRVHQFERNQIQSTTDKPAVKHRFQEEDKEFIKSYPRKIESSVGLVASAQAHSSRAEKRQARKQRKLEEKRAKMLELERLRRLKLSLYAEKIQRIKRTCGAGCELDTEVNDLDIAGTAEDSISQDDPTTETTPVGKMSGAKATLELALHLDEDWDPDKHDQLLARMFDEDYYKIDEELGQKPQFSDDEEEEEEKGKIPMVAEDADDAEEDMNSDHLEEEQVTYDDIISTSKKKKRLTNPYRHLNCEDVIPGPTPDEDVFCRFKYRKVTPNDFGLSTEEVIIATPGELNSWVPIHRVTAYRTDEEEERDMRLFHSNHKLQKKTKIIASLNDPNAHWLPSERIKRDGKSTTNRRKKRSKRKRKRARVEQSTEQTIPTTTSSTQSVKRIDYGKVNGVSISTARLQASGLSVKDVHRVCKRKNKTVEKQMKAPYENLV